MPDQLVPNPIGRPTAMTFEVIGKLEEAFLKGLTDTEACRYVDINSSTLYKYQLENPEFTERKELLKEQVKMRAKLNLAEAIDKKNLPISQWYLERKSEEFKPKAGLEHFGNVTISLQALLNAAKQD